MLRTDPINFKILQEFHKFIMNHPKASVELNQIVIQRARTIWNLNN